MLIVTMSMETDCMISKHLVQFYYYVMDFDWFGIARTFIAPLVL